MRQVNARQKAALDKALAQLKGNPNVVSVGIGFKYRGGKRTDEVCIVVGVREKLPRDQIEERLLVPSAFDDLPTDVIQKGEIVAYAHVQRMRPCPPGFSIGHTAIGAGTLGAYVFRGQDTKHSILSNNHVLADSNNAIPGSTIIQPGKADGGFSGSDRFGRLQEYVRINFDHEQNGGKEASALWKAWRAPANLVGRLVRSPNRLDVGTQALSQPYPNLVDAAVATIWNPGWVNLDIPEIGELQGIRDLGLGDGVQKTGRTTEHTTGTVEEVSVEVKVRYSSGVATFEDQVVVRSSDGEFSAPGDSGSAIVTEDGFLGGLLFAGGENDTIANQISNVVALLGIRL